MALLDILKKTRPSLKELRLAWKKKEKIASEPKEVVDTPLSDVGRQDAGKKSIQKQGAREIKIAPKEPAAKGKKEKGERFAHIIISPRITEKASIGSSGNSYTFNVARNANKSEIRNAIKEIYGVEPIKVNIISVKPKQKMVRNVLGRTASFKKAIVFLKEGDTIEFV